MFVVVNDFLVNINQIKSIDISDITQEKITVYYDDKIEIVYGFHAIEIIWQIKPLAFEGNNGIKWNKHAWSIHNFIGHPLMQILAYLKLYKHAIMVHDKTVPKPIGVRNDK